MSPDKMELVEVQYLNPPIDPWNELASLCCLYFLGDVSSLGLSAVENFLSTHPLILAKVGRKKHIVIGQFRAWEILQVYSQIYPEKFKSVHCIVKTIPEKNLSDEIAEHLFLEGLILSLSPDYAATQISNLWREIPALLQKRILPDVKTQAEFSGVIAHRSRTGFDLKQLHRIKKLIPEPGQPKSQAGESDDNTAS